MRNIITFAIAIFFVSSAMGDGVLNKSNIKDEELLVLKSVKGGEAKDACKQKHSASSDSNSIIRAVEKCMRDGIEVVNKEQTNLNVSNFCNLKSNQIRYGFTTDNKCKRKIVDFIGSNWIMY